MKKSVQTATGFNPPIRAFTPEQGAAVVGLSRPAFLEHVKSRNIIPDVFVGKRGAFSLACLVAFRKSREGVKKRGPKPKQATDDAAWLKRNR